MSCYEISELGFEREQSLLLPTLRSFKCHYQLLSDVSPPGGPLCQLTDNSSTCPDCTQITWPTFHSRIFHVLRPSCEYEAV